MGKCNLRDHLLHAAEAYALAEQNPSMVKKLNIERPAWHEYDNRDTLWAKIPSGLSSLGFDGHFGVHRVLQKGIDVR